jgi:hypothetical protein
MEADLPLFSNMYGVHPRLTILDRNGDAAGLLFLNSAAQVDKGTTTRCVL